MRRQYYQKLMVPAIAAIKTFGQHETRPESFNKIFNKISHGKHVIFEDELHERDEANSGLAASLTGG